MSLKIEVRYTIATPDGSPVCMAVKRRIIPRLGAHDEDLPDELANALIELERDSEFARGELRDQLAAVARDVREAYGR